MYRLAFRKLLLVGIETTFITPYDRAFIGDRQ